MPDIRPPATRAAAVPYAPGQDLQATPPARDVIKPDVGRRIPSEAGDIREVALPKTKRPPRRLASFTSVDGQTYSFQTHTPNGKVVPNRELMALFVALVEVAKGGSPGPVLSAFNVRIQDANDKEYFPIPAHVWQNIPEPVTKVDEDFVRLFADTELDGPPVEDAKGDFELGE